VRVEGGGTGSCDRCTKEAKVGGAWGAMNGLACASAVATPGRRAAAPDQRLLGFRSSAAAHLLFANSVCCLCRHGGGWLHDDPV